MSESILITIDRPEGYEDIHPELCLEDFLGSRHVENWNPRLAQEPAAPQVSDAMVMAALMASNEAQIDPLMVNCIKCDGKGFHHGDWCDDCGGSGEHAAPSEDERVMRIAIQAALEAALKGEGE